MLYFCLGSIYAHTAGLDTRILTGPAEIQKEVDESKHWLVGKFQRFISEVYVEGFVQERRNSSALAMELRLSCTNPLMCVELQDYEIGN